MKTFVIVTYSLLPLKIATSLTSLTAGGIQSINQKLEISPSDRDTSKNKNRKRRKLLREKNDCCTSNHRAETDEKLERNEIEKSSIISRSSRGWNHCHLKSHQDYDNDVSQSITKTDSRSCHNESLHLSSNKSSEEVNRYLEEVASKTRLPFNSTSSASFRDEYLVSYRNHTIRNGKQRNGNKNQTQISVSVDCDNLRSSICGEDIVVKSGDISNEPIEKRTELDFGKSCNLFSPIHPADQTLLLKSLMNNHISNMPTDVMVEGSDSISVTFNSGSLERDYTLEKRGSIQRERNNSSTDSFSSLNTTAVFSNCVNSLTVERDIAKNAFKSTERKKFGSAQTTSDKKSSLHRIIDSQKTTSNKIKSSRKGSECLRRIQKEWKDAVTMGIAYDWSNMKTLSNSKSREKLKHNNYVRIGPFGKNIFRWHFSVLGPANSVYEVGVYHGRVLLPKDYPGSPPRVQMLSPSGRFIPGKDICLSASNYHPETWTPRWTVLSLVDALRMHMLTNANEIGGVVASDEIRREYALNSRTWRFPGVADHKHMITNGIFSNEKTEIVIEKKQVYENLDVLKRGEIVNRDCLSEDNLHRERKHPSIKMREMGVTHMKMKTKNDAQQLKNGVISHCSSSNLILSKSKAVKGRDGISKVVKMESAKPSKKTSITQIQLDIAKWIASCAKVLNYLINKILTLPLRIFFILLTIVTFIESKLLSLYGRI